MTTEQKAKRYDEAIIKAKALYNQGLINPPLEHIFPELAESEDEKIRKTIIRFFKDQYSNETEMYDGSVTVGKVIAWLEKQKPFTDEEYNQGKEDVLWCFKKAKEHAKDENEMGTVWFAEKWLEKQTSNRYIVGADVGSPEGDNWCRFDYRNANIQQTDYAEQKPTDLSKDAKIKESLIEFVKLNMLTSDERYAKYLTWLEKQKPVEHEDIDELSLGYVDNLPVDGEITHDNITEPYWNFHSVRKAFKDGYLNRKLPKRVIG